MRRADAIVAGLLEADDFDPRAYVVSNEQQSFAFLDDVKVLLKLWFDEVEVHPSVPGTGLSAKFFYGGNRYRIRCKRNRAVPFMEPSAQGSRAQVFKRQIGRELEAVAKRHNYFIGDVRFAGQTYHNLLIILDAWPIEPNERVDTP